MAKPHCWHTTGEASSYGTGAPISAVVFCCYCEQRETVTWKIDHRTVMGHGPYLTHAVHRYGTDDKSACPARKQKARRPLRRREAR